MTRPSWDEYFLSIAAVVATRASCDRASVGCVIVLDRHIVATGYNGAPMGIPHCTEAGHDLDEGKHCTRAVHAEVNALCMAARHGVSVKGSTAYVTHYPCWPCARAMAQAGVFSVVYMNSYRRDVRVDELFTGRIGGIRRNAIPRPEPFKVSVPRSTLVVGQVDPSHGDCKAWPGTCGYHGCENS